MNKYEIIGVIDQGAYGIVMKAINKQTKELVAIKRFKDSDQDQTVYKNIQREIYMLKNLKSEYVIELKEAFRKKGKVYLVFEYMSKNLLNIIQEQPQGIPKTQISLLIYKLVRSIYYLHSNNVIHRDIKPENILVSKEQQLKLKLCDFGFTRTISQNRMTDYVATRWYRSPQLLVGQQYGKQIDMWAIGCIMGQMIDGQPLFPGQNQTDQIYQIKKTFGSLSPSQQSILKTSKNFKSVTFPEIKIIEPLQMKYINKMGKTQLNFLKCCLRVNPAQRLAALQALNHPYLQQHARQFILQNQMALIQSNRRKRSHPQISSVVKNQSQTKNSTFSNKKFSFQGMFSKDLSKYNFHKQLISPRKLIEQSPELVQKQHTSRILPKLSMDKALPITKSQSKNNSLELKINNVRTIYNNFPTKFRQSKNRHLKKRK